MLGVSERVFLKILALQLHIGESFSITPVCSTWAAWAVLIQKYKCKDASKSKIMRRFFENRTAATLAENALKVRS